MPVVPCLLRCRRLTLPSSRASLNSMARNWLIKGKAQYIARLHGALGFTAVHGTAALFAPRLWNLPERYARCDYCSVHVYDAGQITASGLPRKKGPCWNIMMWQRSLPVLYLHHSPA